MESTSGFDALPRRRAALCGVHSGERHWSCRSTAGALCSVIATILRNMCTVTVASHSSRVNPHGLTRTRSMPLPERFD